MAELQKLKASVYRATEPSGSDGEGDPTAMVEINIILQEHPNLMVEAVKAIKARCKDKNESVQVIALDLLDQCMQSNGIQLQMHVMKKVLPRVLKFANPSKRECGRLCEQKSAALIKSWATSYGGDGRMKDFENAAKDLARAEEKLQLQRAAAARMAASQRSVGGSVDDTMFPRLGNQANADRARDLQSGIPPMRYGSPPAPSGLAFDDGFSGGQGMPTVDVDQARESLELMTMMMQDRDTDLRHNEVLAEVAMLCKGCRAAIQQQIAGVQDESKLVAMLKLNDDLSDQLDAYEQVMEANTAMTDGTEFQSPTQGPLPTPAPGGDYDEEEEMRRAIAESMKSHQQETVQATKRADMDALNDIFGSPGHTPQQQPPPPPPAPIGGGSQFGSVPGANLSFGGGRSDLDGDRVLDPVHRNIDRENYGESNAIAINAQDQLNRRIELMSLAGNQGPAGTAPPASSPPAPAPSATYGSPPVKVMSDLQDIFGPSTMAAGSPPAYGSPPAASVDPGDLMSAPSPSPAGTGGGLNIAAPGASPAQLQQWFLRLTVNKEGVLYEDGTVQVGLKTRYQGNTGQLGVFIGNKRQEELSNFELVLGNQTPELSCMCTTAGTSIAPRQQMQLTATVECHAPFRESPPLTIKFTGGGEQRVMNLRLPVVAAKFIEPRPMDQAAFDAAWDACLYQGTGVKAAFKGADKWMSPEVLKAMLANGLHFAVVEGSAAPLHAAGSLHGATCYLTVGTNHADKMVTVAVHAEQAALRDSMEELLKLLLAAPMR